ncbi:hypothetical protein P691DRAFT_807820 [Macrolepiota fuliginosa MF-IS2]|uniref:Uncharacterized protein n=1 Tax=Macrolepiota fuliginosa MF-IS2 TaxID=1400762 RepID=A0A9P5XIB4_9AGAR|nr:hypothetical protein P691DRAFT_807820 [Macrolepiota fuliginosa MF-IS2]
MARRSTPSAQPSYLPHPLNAPRRTLNDPNESSFSRFLNNEIWAPEKLPGNINILTGVTLFLGGIAAVRTWGELMIPA